MWWGLVKFNLNVLLDQLGTMNSAILLSVLTATSIIALDVKTARISDVLQAILSKSMNCTDVTRAYLNQINATNAMLHAVISNVPSAMAVAEQLDADFKKTNKPKGIN